MPYIKESERKYLNKWLDSLTTVLTDLTNGGRKNSGAVTYVIYRILIDLYSRGNFEIKSNALKVLSSVEHEYYRKVLSPYEEKKEKENGPILPKKRKNGVQSSTV